VTEIKDNLDRTQRQERNKAIFKWLSQIQYRQHHKTTVVDILPGSAQRYTQRTEYLEWEKSSVSTILWLHGIPGSGKSKVMATVIDHILTKNSKIPNAAPLAYFYCLRSAQERERADPDFILRAILKQLSCTKLDIPIRESVVEAYEEKNRDADESGCEPLSLNLKETTDLIINLLKTNPATIIIDALDECDYERRPELLKALDRIIGESLSIVKVLVSSRDDNNIVCHLDRSPNIYIEAEDNSDDIKRFTQREVARSIDEKRLLSGEVSVALKEQITKTLIDRAQGM
jgi:hypothetical protein